MKEYSIRVITVKVKGGYFADLVSTHGLQKYSLASPHKYIDEDYPAFNII